MVARAAVGGRFSEPGRGAEHGGAPLLGLSLAERQERAFLEAGMGFGTNQTEAPARLLVRSDVAVGSAAILALAAEGKRRGVDLAWRVGGRTGGIAAEVALGDPGPWLVFLAGGADPTPERIAAAEPVEIDPAERLLTLSLSDNRMTPDLVELPLSERVVLPTGHWVQLLWANLFSLAPFLWRALAGRNAAQMAWRLGAAALWTRSLDPGRLAGRLVRRGSGVRIHPSAVVEGSWLGDGVRIGANAVVRGAVLADGSDVGEHALLEFSVLQPGARVGAHGLVRHSVLGTGAAVSGAAQLSVFGPGAQVHRGALVDVSPPGADLRVRAGDRTVRAPLGLAGAYVGAGGVVGPGARVEAGRALADGETVGGGA